MTKAETVAAPETAAPEQVDMFAALLKQQDDLQKQINEAAQAKKDELKQQVNTLAKALNVLPKVLLSELFAAELATRAATTATTGTRKPQTISVNYRNPDNIADEWSGKGRGPIAWLQELHKAWALKNPKLEIDDVKEACKAFQTWFAANPNATADEVKAKGGDIRAQYTEV